MKLNYNYRAPEEKKLNPKVSDFIQHNDWFSFLKNSVLHCPFDVYGEILTEYFELSDKEQLHFDLSYVLVTMDLAGLDNATKTYHQNASKNGMSVAKDMLPVEEYKLIKNYTWPNAFEAINQLLDRYPLMTQALIEHPDFTDKAHLIVLNNNIYVQDKCIETEAFHRFFNRIFQAMNSEQFNTFYQKNDLYINKNHTPDFRIFLDKHRLEHLLESSEKNHPKKKI